jgi:hypothetical protein
MGGVIGRRRATCAHAAAISSTLAEPPPIDTLGGMCSRAECATCSRPTFKGCGNHVEQVLGHRGGAGHRDRQPRSLTHFAADARRAWRVRTGGFYRWVRPPIYAGIMALTVGLAIRSSSVAVAVATAALIAWLMVKARWEESRLEARYPAYVAYAARTPRFVPFWGRWP